MHRKLWKILWILYIYEARKLYSAIILKTGCQSRGGLVARRGLIKSTLFIWRIVLLCNTLYAFLDRSTSASFTGKSRFAVLEEKFADFVCFPRASGSSSFIAGSIPAIDRAAGRPVGRPAGGDGHASISFTAANSRLIIHAESTRLPFLPPIGFKSRKSEKRLYAAYNRAEMSIK